MKLDAELGDIYVFVCYKHNSECGRPNGENYQASLNSLLGFGNKRHVKVSHSNKCDGCGDHSSEIGKLRGCYSLCGLGRVKNQWIQEREEKEVEPTHDRRAFVF